MNTKTTKDQKPTPGPWKLGAHRTQVWATTTRIVDTATFGHDVDTDEANARLIAASPDLLESVKYLLDALSRPGAYDPAKIDAVRKIVARAEGKEVA